MNNQAQLVASKVLQSSIRECTKGSSFLIAIIAVCVTGVPAMAQPGPARPEHRDCSDIKQMDFDSRAEWINERIDCKQKNVNSQVFDMVEKLEGSDLFTDTQMNRIRNGCERAERARERNRESGSYSQFGRSSKTACFIKEIIGDNIGDDDGICITKGNPQDREDCEEILDDGIGDDDGICETKGMKQEACVEVCDSEMAGSDNNINEASVADTEEELEDLAASLEEANVEVEAQIAYFKAVEFRIGKTNLGSHDCMDVLIGDRPPLSELGIALVVANSSYKICLAVANLDVAGFNASPLCAVAEGVAVVLQKIVTVLQEKDEGITQQRFDESMACLQQLDDVTKETLSKVDNLEDLVANLTADIAEIMNQLKTPQGLREGYPLQP